MWPKMRILRWCGGWCRLLLLSCLKTVPRMADYFAQQARAFVLQLDRLNLWGRKNYQDFPDDTDKSKVRVLLPQAEFLSMQRTNVLKDFTLPELLILDLGDAFLRWAADLSMPRFMELLDARLEVTI